MKRRLVVTGVFLMLASSAEAQPVDTAARKEQEKMKHSTITKRSIRGNDSIPWYDTPLHRQPLQKRTDKANRKRTYGK